jgi:DNA-binding PadR family transcriptional regulator
LRRRVYAWTRHWRDPSARNDGQLNEAPNHQKTPLKPIDNYIDRYNIQIRRIDRYIDCYIKRGKNHETLLPSRREKALPQTGAPSDLPQEENSVTCTSHHYAKKRGRGRRRQYGPWAWEGRFFGRGELPLAILSLLDEEPRHGYELMKQLETRSHGLYKASAGTIYPMMQQLQDQGFVTSKTDDGDKRVYTLTDQGREKIKERADVIDRIWGRAEDDEWGGWSYAANSDAAEVMRPAFRLMRAGVRAVARAEDTEETAELVRDILRKARKDIEQLNKG